MAWALAAPASLVGDLYDDSVFVIEVIPDCGPTWKNGICSAWVHVGRLFGSHAHREWMRNSKFQVVRITSFLSEEDS